MEPVYRQALNTIFDDLECIASDERDLVSAFLNSIEQPLRDLRMLGFAILGIRTTGKMVLQNGGEMDDWNRVYYLIVPREGFFRVGKDLSATVHRFDPKCEHAIAELVQAAKEKTPISVWRPKELLMQQLEGNVPWCFVCCLGEMAS